MPFIPFIDDNGQPLKVVPRLVNQDLFIELPNLNKLQVAPELLEQAQMVIRNQLLELFMDHLLRKPNNEQSAYEAEQLGRRYYQRLLQDGGIRW